MSSTDATSLITTASGNLLTVVVMATIYFIYIKCGGSRCKYTSEKGFNISFNDSDDEDDDEEDRHIKEMMKLLVKRKTLKKRNSLKIVIPKETFEDNTDDEGGKAPRSL